MRKPEPKSKSKQQNETRGGAQNPAGPWTEKTVGKALDVAKAGMSSIGSLVDLGKEVQRTRQVEINATVQIKQAIEKTEQTRIQAVTDILAIQRDHSKDQMEHDREMQRLKDQREKDAALILQRDRVLDKILDNSGGNVPQLADSLRVLLSNGDQH